jgi:predicted TIM-barrel fold metal-dependent hydrolase
MLANWGKKYDVVDAEGHILEPLDLWEKYIDRGFRDRAPQVFTAKDGRRRLHVDAKVFGGRQRLDALMKYDEGLRAACDPHARISSMGALGIDAVFFYPSLSPYLGSVQDPPLAAALCRAYNRWLADYCKPYPDRLFGVAMLPLQSVELAMEEMRFARRELGMLSAFIRPNPYNNKMLRHPDYEPFWNMAEELDMAIGIHEGSSLSAGTASGIDPLEGRSARYIISHTMEMMVACMSVIWGGVCERHPKVRIGFLGSGGGWIAPWLDRMDQHFEEQNSDQTGLKTRPSELFRRNCWISFEPVEGSLAVLADYIGPSRILWSSHYPRPRGIFPGAPKMIEERLEHASPEAKRQVLAGGAIGFYGLR